MGNLEQAIRDALREDSQNYDPRARERILHTLALAGTQTRHRRVWLVAAATAVAGAVLAVSLGPDLLNGEPAGPGTTNPTTSSQTGNDDGTSCLTAFRFRGNSYILVMGKAVRSVTLGSLAGRGQFEPCADAAGSGPSGSRSVYTFADVPIDQAIVLEAGNRGEVLVNSEKPAGGWDPKLEEFLSDSQAINVR